jgi:hypothetical protein
MATLKAGARNLLSRKDVDNRALADVIPAEDGKVSESTVTMDQPTHTIPHEGLRQEEDALKAVDIVTAAKQLLGGLGMGLFGKQAGSCIGAVQHVKIAHDLGQ